MHTGYEFYAYQNSTLLSVWTPINTTAEEIKQYYSAYFISCIFNEVYNQLPMSVEETERIQLQVCLHIRNTGEYTCIDTVTF